MKLKFGARRDTSASTSSERTDEVNCSDSSPRAEEENLKADINAASTSCSEVTMMDTESDGSCSLRVCDGNSEQLKQSNVSILHFFQLKNTGNAGVSCSGESTLSTRNGSSESISSISVESRDGSEVEGVQISQDCEMSD